MKSSQPLPKQVPAWQLLAFLLLLLGPFLTRPLHALSVIPPSFNKLVSSSEQIVRVKVSDLRCQWDETPTGHRVIHTYVDYTLEELIQGTPPTNLTLRFLGGRVGNDEMIVHDMPVLEKESSYILFIGENGRAFCPLVGVMYGGYKILRNPSTGSEHLCRMNGEALRDTQTIQTRMEEGDLPADFSGMSPAAFREAIRKEAVHVR